MKRLSKAEILSANDLPSEDVDVPEWGGVVRIRTMSGTERDAMEQSLLGPDGKPTRNTRGLRARVVALTAIDEEGNRLFTEGEAEQLGTKSAAALSRLFDAAAKLNGLTSSDVEQLAKN